MTLTLPIAHPKLRLLIHGLGLSSLGNALFLQTTIFTSTQQNTYSRGIEQTPKKISAQKEFNEYLFQAIDEVLTSLGEPVKNTLYFQLENNFNITKNEIPNQ